MIYLTYLVSCDSDIMSKQLPTSQGYSEIHTCENSTFAQYKSYLNAGGTIDSFNNNPIDKSFLENEMPFSTVEIVDYYSKYINLWEIELDNTLAYLKNNLAYESYTELEIAQDLWRKYMIKDLKTAENMHIDTMGIGSEIPILSSHKVLLLIRQRTLELAEYCIMVSGNYDFIFGN